MKLLKALLTLELLIGLIWLFNMKLGNLPPFGKLLSPSIGFWKNAEPVQFPRESTIQLAALQQPVTIQYDRIMVPHVFADSDYDLYFAQGYITAKDRLWQMDFQSRMAAGRMSEVMGMPTLNQDRYFRRIGLTYAAERSLELMMKDAHTKMVLEAYTAGVNAWISGLNAAHYPIEFKMLNYAPEAWTPLKTVLVFKLMAETLSSSADDLQMTNTLRRMGNATVQNLFPDQPYLNHPVIPSRTAYDFTPEQLPQPPVDNTDAIATNISMRPHVQGVGSNNWVISGRRSLEGFPLLANDPHLALTLPAIWYQVQLAGPGVNVYGASIPGIPCVIIGYNQQIAWGVTNAETDLTDWYRVLFRDASRKEYRFNGQWHPVKERYEKVVVRGDKNFTDTVLYVHQGPVIRSDNNESDNTNLPAAFAIKWIAHEPSEEIRAFYLLNRAGNYREFRDALQFFGSPAQNFVYAGRDSTIALVTGGKFPLRYKDQGKFVLDGSSAATDWQGWIPSAQNPAVLNPARGFVSSANQQITDSTYPYYVSWQAAPAERAIRIDSRLAQMHGATTDSLRLLQNDTYSVLGEKTLPVMLQYVGTFKEERYTAALESLKQWNYHYDAGSRDATVFNLWWNILYRNIWSDEFDKKGMPLRWPGRDRTIQLLLQEKKSPWFDDRRTIEKEGCGEMVKLSFVEAIDSLTHRFGTESNRWKWGQVRKCSIHHLAGIDAFSIGPFGADGVETTVNAMTENFGPSWRMVVQLGPEVKGYGIFPGGQSGNPGSPYYDNLFRTWKQGRLEEFIFLKTKNDKTGSVITTLSLIK